MSAHPIGTNYRAHQVIRSPTVTVRWGENKATTRMLGDITFGRVDPKWHPPTFGYPTFFPIHFFDLVFGKNVWEKGGEKVRYPNVGGYNSEMGRQKVLSPNIWVISLFLHTFFRLSFWEKCMGKKVGYPNVGGYHSGRGRPESDIPQHSGSSFFCTPPHRYCW
jgi:hypothetical protein